MCMHEGFGRIGLVVLLLSFVLSTNTSETSDGCSPKKWLSFTGLCTANVPLTNGPLLCGSDSGLFPSDSACEGSEKHSGQLLYRGDTLECTQATCERTALCGGILQKGDSSVVFLVSSIAAPPFHCEDYTAETCPDVYCAVDSSSCVQSCPTCTCYLPVDTTVSCVSGQLVGGVCECDPAKETCVEGVCQANTVKRSAVVQGEGEGRVGAVQAELGTCPDQTAAIENDYIHIGTGFCHDSDRYVDAYRIEYTAGSTGTDCCALACSERSAAECLGFETVLLASGGTACHLFTHYSNWTNASFTFHSGTGGAKPLSIYHNADAECYSRTVAHEVLRLHWTYNCDFTSEPLLTIAGSTESSCFHEVQESYEYSAARFNTTTLECAKYPFNAALTPLTNVAQVSESTCVFRTFSVVPPTTTQCCEVSSTKQGIDKHEESVSLSCTTETTCRLSCIFNPVCTASYWVTDAACTGDTGVCYYTEEAITVLDQDKCGTTRPAGSCHASQEHPYKIVTQATECEAPLSVISQEDCATAAAGLGMLYVASDQSLGVGYPHGCWYDSVNGLFHYNSEVSTNAILCVTVGGECHVVCSSSLDADVMEYSGCAVQDTMKGDLLFGPIAASDDGLTYGDCYVQCMGSAYFAIQYNRTARACWCSRSSSISTTAEFIGNDECTALCKNGGELSGSGYVNCMYKTKSYGCFTLLGSRKVCPGGFAFPNIEYRMQCESLCLTQTTCTHINWYEYAAVKCELLYSCSSEVWTESRYGDVYMRALCESTKDSFSDLRQLSFPSLSISLNAGACSSPAPSADELALFGTCNFPPETPGYTCKQPTTAEALLGYYGAIVIEVDGEYLCSCDDDLTCSSNGMCGQLTATVVLSLTPRTPLYYDGEIFAQYVGLGACQDKVGLGYRQFSRDFYGIDIDPDGAREKCITAAMAAANTGACPILAFQIERLAVENVLTISNYGVLRCSVLTSSTLDLGLDAWTLMNAFDATETSDLIPSQSNQTSNALCYAYSGGSCSTADNCKGCASSGCSIENGACVHSISKTACTLPCHSTTVPGTLRAFCDMGSMQGLSMTANQWHADWPTFTVTEADSVYEFVSLDSEWETCEAAGLETIVEVTTCRQALCAVVNSTLPEAFSSDSTAPTGCVLRCNGENCASIVRFSTTLNVNNDCTDGHFRCLCRRRRGAVLQAAVCISSDKEEEDEDHDPEYILKTSGYGCGSPDVVTSYRSSYEDITDEKTCVRAVCQLLGVKPKDDEANYLGGYPIVDSWGSHHVYTGSAHGKQAYVTQGSSDAWGGGCSVVRDVNLVTHSVFYAPPNACSSKRREAECERETECWWNDAGCQNLRQGFSLCTETAPCICKSIHESEHDTPPEAPANEGSTSCIIWTEHWDSGVATQCDACAVSTDLLDCGEGGVVADIHDSTITLAAGESQTLVIDSYADPDSYIVVKKHYQTGKARLGVMFGDEPDMNAVTQVGADGEAWYHCRTDAEEGSAACKMPACGPLAVTVLAPTSDAVLRLTVCSFAFSTTNFTNAVPSKHRECCSAGATCTFAFPEPILGNHSVTGTACECAEIFEGADCSSCVAGTFPAPGTVAALNGISPCTQTCRQCGDVPCGVYDTTVERCICEGSLTGDLCERDCNSGSYGTFCNETFPALVYETTKSFNNVLLNYTPPPWAVLPNSQVTVTITADNMDALASVQLIAKQVVTTTGQVNPEETAKVVSARSTISTGTVLGAYYGPLRTARSSVVELDDIYLHVFLNGDVHRYLYNADKTFAFAGFEVVETVYSECIQYLGAGFGSTMDAVFFLQDRGVENGYIRLDDITYDETVFVLGGRYCAVGGFVSPQGGLLQELLGFFTIDTTDEPTRLRAGYSASCKQDGIVTPCIRNDDDTWDDIVVYRKGSGQVGHQQSIGFIKGTYMMVLEQVGARLSALAPLTSAELDAYAESSTVSKILGPEVANPTAAATLALNLQFDYDDDVLPPVVVFSHSKVFFGNGTSLPVAEVLYNANLPQSMVIMSGPTRTSSLTTVQAGVTEGDSALSFKLTLHNSEGRKVSVTHDAVVVYLLECGQPLTTAQQEALALLKAREGDNGGNLDALVTTEEDCGAAVSGAKLIGTHAEGVFAGATAVREFRFTSLAINRAGRYRVVFRHVKSGLEVVSGDINVVSTNCDDALLWDQADECTTTCAVAENATSLECVLTVSNNKHWAELAVTTSGYTTAAFTLEMVQPCCSGKGLCCAGNYACSEHQAAFDYTAATDITRCTCLESEARGYWDQRANSNCSLCKAGFTGNDCTGFEGKNVTLPGVNHVQLDAGDRTIFVVPVTPETPVTLRIVSESGDADAVVAYGMCPGQEGITALTIIPEAMVAVPCSGRGQCVMDDAIGPVCECDAGFYLASCSAQCCSAHGSCDVSGNNCICHNDDSNGHWERSRSVCSGDSCSAVGGADDLPADHCAWSKTTNTGTFYAHCNSGATPDSDNPGRIWASWRGIPTPTKHKIDYVGLVLPESSSKCTTPQKVYVYATRDTANADVASTWFEADAIPCDVYTAGSVSNCTTDSTLDSATSKCLCSAAHVCIRGRCLDASLRCGAPSSGNAGCTATWPWSSMSEVNSTCTCPVSQGENDEVTEFLCENGACNPKITSLKYTWNEGNVWGQDYNEDSIAFTQLQWASLPTAHGARFFHEVASFEQSVPHDGNTRVVDITDWVSRTVEGIRTATFDLSFVFVSEAGGCHVSLKGPPALRFKTYGGGQPSRLFFTSEVAAKTEDQSGHPFYALSTADSVPTDSTTKDTARLLKRYVTKTTEVVTVRPASTTECVEDSTFADQDCLCGKTNSNSRGGKCNCPQETTFQDPIDFVQVADMMYFLAITDWESSPDLSAPCTESWAAGTQVHQGSREIFFTKGLPRTGSGDDADATASRYRHGAGTFPSMEALTEAAMRQSLLSTRVFTRAKELTKMANPDNDAYQAEMLLYAAADRGGDTVTVALGTPSQETIKSTLVSKLWRLKLGTDGTPAAQPEAIATDVMFPSFLTPIQFSNNGVKTSLVFFLAQAKFTATADDYHPLGASPGYNNRKSQHQYLAETRLNVYASDGSNGSAILVASASQQNVPVCLHGQSHPGFVFFKGSVHFHYDNGTGLQLFAWNVSDMATMATPIALEVNDADLTPHIPPMHKGYFKPTVSVDGAFLYLSLSMENGGSAAESGGCLNLPVCGDKVHTFQKSFACLGDREAVGMWWWDGETEDAGYGVHLGRVVEDVDTAADPKWLTPTPQGVFWVGHPGGMTNMGAFLSKTVTGKELPAEQFASPEKQTLWYVAYPTKGSDGEYTHSTPVAVWETGVPVEMYGFTVWEESLLFWSHSKEELDAAYADFNGSASECFPPGRLQEVLHAPSVGGAGLLTKMMSGVNIPAYEGCSRHLYSVSLESLGTPQVQTSGTSNDGAGVPRRQCCPESFGVEHGDWANSTESMSDIGGHQAGRVCEVGAGCAPNAAVAGRTAPRGCLQCNLPRGVFEPLQEGLDEDFPYPTYLDPTLQNYSVNQAWGRPHSGWWFTGFQSMWLDNRTSRASGEETSQQGKAVNEHIRGEELYRPGGFAWREHWPTVMAVFTEKPADLRDSCDDCEAGYYGVNCTKACPVWNSKVCNGYPCSDGYFGNGTCLCTGRGTYCNSDAETTSATYVSSDAFVTVVSNCDDCTDSDCIGTDDVKYCGKPDAASCPTTCGVHSDEPCCGRGAEPLQVSATKIALLAFTNLAIPSQLGSVTLRLNEAAGSGCSDTAQKLLVYVVDASLERSVHGNLTYIDVANALAAPTAVQVGSVAVGRTMAGTTYVDIDSSKLDVTLGDVDATVVLALKGSGACTLQYTTTEFAETWVDACAAVNDTFASRCGEGTALPDTPLTSSTEYSSLLYVDSLATTVDSVDSSSASRKLLQTLPLNNHYTFDPATRQHAALADTSRVSSSAKSSYLTEEMKSASHCILRGNSAEESCKMLSPINAGFVYVEVTAFQGNTAYTMELTHTPPGFFNSEARFGRCMRSNTLGHWSGTLCLDCHFRYDNGKDCLAYMPETCTTSTCPASAGTCKDDIETQNWNQMCACNDGLYGVNCDKPCDETTCLQGTCLETGDCECHEDDVLGHWEGTGCNECKDGYYGASCQACGCHNGVCNATSTDGSCLDGQCETGWTGANCTECDTSSGYYGFQTCVLCTSDTCANGTCSTTNGSCECNADYYKNSAGDCTYCSDAVTCNGHGACTNTANEAFPCECENSNWDALTHCLNCTSAYWGATCEEDCWCNVHGYCHPDTGVCICSQSDELGYFSGSACERCSEGYSSGPNGECTTQGTTTGTSRLGRPFSFASELPTAKRTTTESLRGAIFHAASVDVERIIDGADAFGTEDTTQQIVQSDKTKEIMMVSAGTRLVSEQRLPVDVWVKDYDNRVNFNESWRAQLSVHAKGLDFATRGESVVEMFQHSHFIYFVVEDETHPYLGRLWLTPACSYCTFPLAEHGLKTTTSSNIPYNNSEGAHTCANGCDNGTQVRASGTKGVVVQSNRTTHSWVITEVETACVPAEEECLGEYPTAHLHPDTTLVPLPTAQWMTPVGYAAETALVQHLVTWSKVEGSDYFLAVVRKARITSTGEREEQDYYLQVLQTGEFSFGQLVQSFPLTEFNTVHKMHGYISPDKELVALIFGINVIETYVMQAVYPRDIEVSPTYGSVVPLQLQLCGFTDCQEVEKVVALNTLQGTRHANDLSAVLLFIRTVSAGVTQYQVQRIDLKNLKSDQASDITTGHYCNQWDDQTVCEAAQCTWNTACVRTQRASIPVSTLSGIGTATLDHDFGNIYFSFGALNPTERSEVYKFDALRLEVLHSRTMDYGHVTTEVEAIVAASIDVARRAVFTVAHMTRTSVAVVNAYDVTFITPNISDAPTATTNVTVFAVGLSTLNGTYAPKCSMGVTESDGEFETVDGVLRIRCPAKKPISHSSCTWLPMEISLTREEDRWTETNLLIKRSNTALILSLGTDVNDFTFPSTPAGYLQAKEATVTIPGPELNPFGTTTDDPFLLQTVQPICGGPYNVATVVTVLGAGFFESPFLKCKFGDVGVTDGTFLTTMRMLCQQPVHTAPATVSIEVALDGQIFSTYDVAYHLVGDAVSMDAFFTCDPTLPDDCSEQNEDRISSTLEITLQSDDLVTLFPLMVVFKDSSGTFVGNVWSKAHKGQVRLSLDRGLNQADGSEVVGVPTEGRVMFNKIHLRRPLSGQYSIGVTYSDEVTEFSASIVFNITGGEPDKIEFAQEPPHFSNNRAPLTKQPRINLVDEASNSVLDQEFEVHVSFDEETFPLGLMHNGEKVIQLQEPIARFTGGSYDFTQLSVSVKAGMPEVFSGRSIQYEQLSATSFQLLNFTLIFTVYKNNQPYLKLNQLEWVMHMVDCSLDTIGRNSLAWIEPEELPIGSTIPIVVKGWGFQDLGDYGQYRCQFRTSDSAESLVVSVEATFVDSCSISCLPPTSVTGHAGMRIVKPALCCMNNRVPSCPLDSETANCMPEGAAIVASFNESSVQKKVYHRYVDPQGQNLSVWNLKTDLPDWDLQSTHPYTNALTEQTTVEQIVSSVDATKSVGLRKSKSNDYVNQQFNLTDGKYELYMYSDSIVNSESVLRSSDKVTIAGTKFWTNNDWQLGASVDSLNSGSGSLVDTSFLVALRDDAVGLHGWPGNWVADQQLLQTGTVTTSQVEMTITPLATRSYGVTSSQYATVKGGDTEPLLCKFTTADGGDEVFTKSVTKSMSHSYTEFREVTLLYPAAGTYTVTFSSPGSKFRSSSIVVTVLEGVPHEVVFDSAAHPNGVSGVPMTTQRAYKELAIQPRFRLLDVAGNTIQKLPAAHAINVRVKDITPWPRCLEPCVSNCPPDPLTPGMWGVKEGFTTQGVCLWNTPDPAVNITDAAVALRKAYDPAFDTSGVAAYGASTSKLNVWASDATDVSYNITFAFYGAGLEGHNYSVPDLSLPAPLSVSECAAVCSDGERVCQFKPSVLSISSAAQVSEEVILFGDYFDFTQSRKTDDKLRVELRIAVDQSNFICHIPARRRDTCSILIDYPACEYLCRNLHPDLTDLDRTTCCETGKTLALDDCTPHTTTRHADTLAQVSTIAQALVAPASVFFKVATSCVGVDCSAELDTLKESPGPPRVGPAAQLGVHEAETACLASGANLTRQTITVVSKDNSSNTLFERDTATRRVNLFLQKSVTSSTSAAGVVWVGPEQCTTDSLSCFPHAYSSPEICAVATRDCVFFETESGEPTDNTGVMVNGVVKFYVVIQAPLQGTYAVHVIDVSDVPSSELLPSCAGPYLVDGRDLGQGGSVSTSNGTHFLPYRDSVACSVQLKLVTALHQIQVCRGEPFRLAWGSTPTNLTRNTDTITEYILEVQDYAGNVLSGSTLATKVFVNVSRTVPELRTAEGAMMLARRGVENTEQNIRDLEQQACFFNMSSSAGANTAQLGADVNAAQVKFNLRQLRVWHGMSCVLSFNASKFENGNSLSAAAVSVAETLNRNSKVEVTIHPVPCCTADSSSVCSQFAYSFEFGCWNQELKRKISGPNNKGTTGALAGVSDTARYGCLYSCGECEEGMICYGNTSITSKSGHWREPVTYRGWECSSGKCIEGNLGNGLGEGNPTSLAEADELRANRQCGTGTKGPLCGVCERSSTDNAAYGYARSRATCEKCPSQATNVFILILIIIGFLLLIFIMVYSSLNTGNKVQEIPKLAVMIKLFINHLQVSALAGDLAVKWGGLADTIFDIQSSAGGPSSNVLAVSCLGDIDYYVKFAGWLFFPAVVILVPGLFVLLTSLLNSLKGAKEADLLQKEVPPPCKSPYHWMYDWSVPEKDAEELRAHLEKHAEQTESQKREWKINVELRKIANPLKALPLEELCKAETVMEDEFVPIKIQRIALDANSQGGFDVLWETEIELGNHGCWLCKRCCIMEQLFPSPGIGRPGDDSQINEVAREKFYQCDLEEHQVTKKGLQVLFRHELLEAALAQLEVREALRSEYFSKNRQPSAADLNSLADKVFYTGEHAKDLAPERAKDRAYLERLRAMAMATTPPFSVTSHRPFDYPDLENQEAAGTSMTIKKGGRAVTIPPTSKKVPMAEVSLRRKKEESVVLFLQQQEVWMRRSER